VYLMLVETLLQRGAGGVDEAIQIAERNFDKLEPLAFLDLLPSTVPLARLARYLDIVFEHTNTRKRNLQVSLVELNTPCTDSELLVVAMLFFRRWAAWG
jgi:hypothetical protein